MSSTLPFFFSKSKIGQINTEIIDDLTKCFIDWIPEYQPQITIESIIWSESTYKSDHWDSSLSGSEVTFFSVDNPWEEILFSRISSVPKDDTFNSVVDEFKSAITNSVYKILGLSKSSGIGATVEQNSPIQVCKLSQNGFTLIFSVPKSLYKTRYKKLSATSSSISLFDRKESVKPLRCRGEVTISMGSFEIELLKKIAVGDVLSSQVGLDSFFEFKMNGRKALDLRLGKKQGHKAVLVVKGK